MARTSKKVDYEQQVHKDWLGLVQPVGLVVAPPALVKAQAFPDKAIAPVQQRLLDVVETPAARYVDPDPQLTDFLRFAREVLEWPEEDLAGTPEGPELPARLVVDLRDYGDTLRPTYALLDTMADDPETVVLLVSVADTGANLDKPPAEERSTGWHASPHARLERLLRDTEVPAGLLCNGDTLRLVYAPRGESSGYIDFPVAEMTTVGGRSILSALHMLLSEHRVLGADDGQRLLDLMAESRKYQSEVSNRLSEQVLGALWELMRGFQAADEAAGGRVLFDLARTEPDQIYGGLLTVIMRLVFLLYAEDQGLMPDSEVYARNYSIGGLYERLRSDAGRYPDTMEQRFGAWAGLLTTFRLVFDGGGHGPLRLPTRHGQLFNPDEYPFLEGRPPGVHRVMGQTFEAPRVSDGVVWRVLEGLLVLDGERLSYRALDVEQVGSVYESMMGFDVRTTAGRAIAVRPKHVVIDLDKLLAQAPAKRKKWLKDNGETELSTGGNRELKAAKTIDELVAALGRRVSPQTPRPLAPGALFLQPGQERRRSGSHYTPRELTEPIVRTTLRPVLEGLGERPTPEQILDLKVCDPAMGSGAFLVEVCRQLAEALVTAWEVHDCMPKLPPDEDPLLHARRLVAQRCLYGVDKNRFAVNLAKLSLWLVTLARDHAFTFLDHALKHGDSLVGLTLEQIGAFHWDPPKRDYGPLFKGVSASVGRAGEFRMAIQALGEGDYDRRRDAWREAEEVLREARLTGDLCIAAFFGAQKDKEREALRLELKRHVDERRSGRGNATHLLGPVEALRGAENPIPPFHWEVEFPEVFTGDGPGFAAILGNPPFLGGKKISGAFGVQYKHWLAETHRGSSGNADVVAHFFRRSYLLLREGGTSGLVATNTIAQGDTRRTGLRWVGLQGGTIYDVNRRVAWPGLASVVVSVVHFARQYDTLDRRIDGKPVPFISAFLFHGGGHEDPHRLAANRSISYIGCDIKGQGFLFDDTDPAASPVRVMEDLLEDSPGYERLIQPYLGGSEIYTHPLHSHHRWVINFGERSLEEVKEFPELLAIVEEKVRPERLTKSGALRTWPWWRFWRVRREMTDACSGLERVLVIPQTGNALSFTFVPWPLVLSHTVVVFATDEISFFGVLQSRIHRVWALFFAATMKDDARYIPNDCFETFPFPAQWSGDCVIMEKAQSFFDTRRKVMVELGVGLTNVANRFNDPNEFSPEILHLRGLQAEMDRAVLDAYGWTDIPTDCDFFLDYEIDEENWSSRKRKPWRYRWPDEVHDEVLARLLDLNQKRYEEEVAKGLHDKGKRKAKPKKKSPARRRKSTAKKTTTTRDTPTSQQGLFGGADK
jgi:hypothetical protein